MFFAVSRRCGRGGCDGAQCEKMACSVYRELERMCLCQAILPSHCCAQVTTSSFLVVARCSSCSCDCDTARLYPWGTALALRNCRAHQQLPRHRLLAVCAFCIVPSKSFFTVHCIIAILDLFQRTGCARPWLMDCACSTSDVCRLGSLMPALQVECPMYNR